MASSGLSLEAFLAEARARSNGSQQQAEAAVDAAPKKTDEPASPAPQAEDGSAGVGGASTADSTGALHENGVQSLEHGGVASGGEKHDNVASIGLDGQEAAGLFAELKTEQVQVQEEESLPPEVDRVQVPPHWHAKPCVHVTSIGGGMTEEELVSLFSKYGKISSVSFENEKHDAAVIRYEHYVGNTEELVAQVRQGLNGKKLGDMALIVEPFRPDSLLFVGNLTLDIDDAVLWRMFEQHGHIERAFVLRNAEGRSKGYGFVEYSLKSQATTAKMAMGNINMDGRIVRVEWSDCRNVADMFSTVLFIDRLPKGCFHIENSLRDLFGKYGKIKDCHLAIGMNQTYRGFAFIEFAHSISADRAHQALDGRFLEGLHIRVSFANPSKSASYFAQSYKFRYGTEVAAQAALMMKGALGGPAGPIPRGPSQAAPRFMGTALPGMAGMPQFGRGSLEHGMTPPFGGGMVGSASGMQGRGSFFLGTNIPPRLGMPAGASFLQRLPYGQGPISITSSAIAQVATAQAKAREEEARRAEAANQGPMRLDGTAMDQYQKFQQYKQPEAVQQYAQPYQQAIPYQASMQLQNQGSQQSYTAQQYVPYPQQYPQQDNYYQQAGQQSQYGYLVQYGQSQGYQYGQQPGQAAVQPYQQPSEQAQVPYTQQSYGQQFTQEQQQSYTTYCQPQAQAPQWSVADTMALSSSVTSGPQQSYEAQWAAYYAGQAAYQQAGYGQQFYPGGSATAYQEQAATMDAGQKWTADQMEVASQDQASYAYPQSSDYSQQAAFGLQIQPTAVAPTYAQQSAAYQQPSTLSNLPGVGYQQPGAAGADAYPTGVTTFAQAQVGAAGGYDYIKRPRL